MFSLGKIAVLAAIALGAYAVTRMIRVANQNKARQVNEQTQQTAKAGAQPVELELCPHCGAYADLKQHRCA